MPAVSKKQQRLFGIIRAIKKGVFKGKKTPKIQRIASSISDKDSKKMASTKHKGLPEKVKEELNTDDKPFVKKLVGKLRKGSKTHAKQADDLEKAMNEDYVKELEDGLVKMDYPTYDEVDELMKKIAKENDIDTTTLHMAFKTKHLMVPDDWAKKKMFEPVMIPKTPQITGDVDEAVNAAQQAAIAMSKKERLMNLMVAKKKKKRTNESVETINELSQDTMASAAKKAMEKRDAARGTPEYGRRQKQVLKFVSGAVKKRQQRDRAENSFKKPDADRPPTLPESSFNINPEEHNKAKRQAKIRNMTKSSNPNEKKVAERKVADKTQLPKLNTEENINEISADLAGKAARAASKKYQYADNNETKSKAYKQIQKFSTYADKKYRKLNKDRGDLNKTFNKPSATKDIKEGNLRDWFGKSKSKDGKGGWVNVVTGGTCASDEPGEGTPKCVSSSKRASMTKAERLSAQRRKKKADPNQQSKTGAAKPTYVATDKKKKKMNEEIGPDGEGLTPSQQRKGLGLSGSGIRKLKKNMEKKGNFDVKKNLSKQEPDEQHTTTTSEAIEMTRKAYKKIHKDFKSDDPKNPRTTKYVDGKGTVSMPVKFVDEGKSPAWQRKAGKSESGGLNAKGVASYRAANPGSKLKTAVTTKPSKLKKGSKAANRRKSFCARMKGMKKRLTSAKTARDPDSRINKSLRKWNCSFEPESGEMIMERGPQVLGSGARQKSIHAKKGKKGTKKVSGMIKSLKRKGSILKQPLGGPADAAAKARRLSYVKDDVDLTILRFINEGHMNKTCGEGEYYCYQSKKCKKIPKGMKIGYGGMLKPEKDDSEETKGKNGNGNGNGNGHGGNGNGNGNGGGDSGGE